MAARIWTTKQLDDVIALTKGHEEFILIKTCEGRKVLDTSLNNKEVLVALKMNNSRWMVRYDEGTFQ